MVTEKQKKICLVLGLLAAVGALLAHYLWAPWGFYRRQPEPEAALRMQVVQTAESYLGCNESDDSHLPILERYNSHQPLAVGYTVQPTDSWCAAFVSAVSIQCGVTDIIPTECGCQRQIGLFQQLGCWEELDGAIPLPGDLIYYDWDMEQRGECTGWADHVGIVVGTKWPFLKVIEGNLDDAVGYHYLLLDDIKIRGYARPDYAGILQQKTP